MVLCEWGPNFYIAVGLGRHLSGRMRYNELSRRRKEFLGRTLVHRRL